MESESVRHLGQLVSKCLKIALLSGLCAAFFISNGNLKVAVGGQQVPSGAAISPGAKNSCVECHTLMGDALAASVSAMQDDIHAKKGLSCAGCARARCRRATAVIPHRMMQDWP